MVTITITNYLFRQNRTRNITKVIFITHIKKTLQRSCQGDCTEDIIAMSQQTQQKKLSRVGSFFSYMCLGFPNQMYFSELFRLKDPKTCFFGHIHSNQILINLALFDNNELAVIQKYKGNVAIGRIKVLDLTYF